MAYVQIVAGLLTLIMIGASAPLGIYRKKWYVAFAIGALSGMASSIPTVAGGTPLWLGLVMAVPFVAVAMIVYGIGRWLPNVRTA
jgi:hypothetical protein